MTGASIQTRSERLTFVLPICGARDIATARNNLLPSLDALFNVNDIAELLVVGTADAYRSIRFDDVVSRPLAARIRVLSEQDVVGNERSFVRARGWCKQQMIKLAISNRIRTKRYCTLDSDMYLVRPCGSANWIQRGRCIYNPEPLSSHPKWWKCSAQQLGFDLDLDVSDGFGVTPALLYTDIVRDLVQHLETSRKGLVRAIRKGATEYTLYWLFLRKHHYGSDLYDRDRARLYARCLWKRRDVDQGHVLRFVDRQFHQPDHFYFSMIQSTSELADDSVVSYVRAKIQAKAA